MSTLKTWEPWDFAGVDCPHCGNSAEVLTACAKGLVCEDDDARCCACGHCTPNEKAEGLR